MMKLLCTTIATSVQLVPHAAALLSLASMQEQQKIIFREWEAANMKKIVSTIDWITVVWGVDAGKN